MLPRPRAAQTVGYCRPPRGVEAKHLLVGVAGQRPVGEALQELPGVLLVPADRVIRQVLADAVHQV
jgi:hypothetical protein